MADSANIFVSHIHEDDDHIQSMKDLLAGRGYTVKDSSINSTNPNEAKDPAYIKSSILAPRIRWAGTLVVLVSPETCSSEYVNWEIEYAHKTDTRIVGVWIHGASNSDLPEALEKYGDTVVGWNGEKIEEAIRGERHDWEAPDGGQRPERNIKRYGC